MNILHVVIGRPKKEASNGVLKSVYQLAAGQSSGGNNVSVIAFKKGIKTVEKEDVDGFTINLFPRNSTRFNIGREVKKYLINKDNQFDIVHFHSGYHPEYYMISRIIMRLKIPYLISPRGSYQPSANMRNGLIKLVYKFLFEESLIKGASCIHALNEPEAKNIREYSRRAKRIEIIGNGVDVNQIREFAKLELVTSNKPENLTLVYCGRIDFYYKGIDLLLDALALLKLNNIDINLILIGPDWKGGLSDAKNRIRRHNLTNNVKFRGALYSEEKFKEYSNAHAFILPSRTEGMPTSVLEAMAFGMPCIVTEESNLGNEIVRMGGCVKIDLSSKDIADKLTSIYKNKIDIQLCAEIGQRWVEDNYSYPNIIRKHLSNYNQCVG